MITTTKISKRDAARKRHEERKRREEEERKRAEADHERAVAEAKSTSRRRQAEEEERIRRIVEKALKAAKERAEREAAERSKLSTWGELVGLGWRIGRRQTDRLEAAGKFPKRVVLGLDGGKVAWLTAEVVAHVEARIARREAKELDRTRPQLTPA